MFEFGASVTQSIEKRGRAKMFQLLDIAYVIPAMVFVGYFIGKKLEANYGDSNYYTYSILIAALLGFILTFFKIKKYVDQCNSAENKTDQNKNCSQDLSDDSHPTSR